MELKGMQYLKTQLGNKRTRVLTRYDYYSMKNSVDYFSKLLPGEYRWLAHSLGWCGKAVDSIADRLTVNEFRNDNFYMQEIYELNNSDILFDSAILSALVSSCCFIYIHQKDGFPALEVIDGSNATGIIDETTNLLKEGYAVLERNTNGGVTLEAYFEPGKTTFYPADEQPYVVENPAPYPLLVPIINRPDAVRPFGRSRISRACMSLQQGALRTLKRTEVSSEFFAFPQKYVLGLSDDIEFSGQNANYSNFLAFYKDADGEKPVLGQFQQQSMAPHIEQLKMFASLFSGETGLTLDDLGFPSANPSSSESIKATHESLRLTAKKASRTLATGFINAGYLAACIRDGEAYKRQAIYQTKIAWEPLFELDASSMGTIGDAIGKIEASFPGYITEEKMHDVFGV